MAKDSTITLLLADDCVAVRYGLKLWLRLEPDMAVIGEASNGVEALALALRLRPDVVVMDARTHPLGAASAASHCRAPTHFLPCDCLPFQPKDRETTHHSRDSLSPIPGYDMSCWRAYTRRHRHPSSRTGAERDGERFHHYPAARR